MRVPAAAALLVVALSVSAAVAATKDSQQPDPEMLKMMEFLREMEMIKRMEMLQDMQQVESVGDPVEVSAPPKSAPAKKKETVK